MSAYALPGLFPPLESSLAVAMGNLSMTSVAVDNAGTSTRQPCNESDAEHQDNLAKIQVESCEQKSLGVGIAVREARIDSMRLIQELSPSASSTTNSQISSQTGTKHPGRKRRASIQQKKISDCTPQENAMQFELSITFNGRKYTAIRSLPRILQLRQDLVEEVEERKNTLTEHDDHRATPVVSTQEVTIPELPRLQEDGAAASSGTAGTPGFVGRGFSVLHALLLSYVPVMEGWLHKVTSLVPPSDSPSLRQFLWEPLSLNVMQLERGCLSGFQSEQQLTAIEESEDSDSDDD